MSDAETLVRAAPAAARARRPVWLGADAVRHLLVTVNGDPAREEVSIGHVPKRPRDGAVEPQALIDELLRESGA